jgi:uncharacterized cupin superfamily protein
VVDPSTIDSIGTDFVLQAALESQGRRPNATSGDPVESKLVLYADRFTEIGIWEVTPGSFPAAKDGVCELMQFVAGSATIVDANGETTVEPGVTMFTPDGWTGIWTVHETVRKTYALHHTKSLGRRAMSLMARRAQERLGRLRTKGQPATA